MRRRGDGLAVFALLCLAGCAGAPPPQAPGPARERHPVASEDAPYFLDPIASFPFSPDGQRATEVAAAYRNLMDEGDALGAAAAAERLLSVDPGFQPARVLAAQADLARRRFAEAAERLEAAVRDGPESAAAKLLLGRVREALGDVVGAYALYRELADTHAVAAERARELQPRAVEIVAQRFSEASERGRLEEAEAEYRWLAAWEPDGLATLLAARQLAVARGDAHAELAALSRLTPRLPERGDLIERRADLELEMGDPGTAVELYQRLGPGGGLGGEGNGSRREQKLARAKFRWRLTLLPEHVRSLAGRPALTRAGFATLLYWLVPEVRYGRPVTARIASDILEHPQREELARVVNLGLMEIDPTLHSFAPGAPLTRLAALRALLGIVTLRSGPLSCAGDGARAPVVEACAAAVRCRLIPGPEQCLPRSPVSGAESLELIRTLVTP